MNSILTIKKSAESLVLAINPETRVFENTIKTWRWWRIKNRKVTLRWTAFIPDPHYSRPDPDVKSFYPILEDTDGFELISKQAAETHLEKEIDIPLIVTIQRKASHQGRCNVCGRFHLEQGEVKIQITGEESVIVKKDFPIPEDLNECINTKCSNQDCNGWVPKKLVLRE
jgi:hypothetical protein